MGCDIHMIVEVKQTVNGKTKWFNYDHFRKNLYFGEYEDEREWERIDLCRDRNYIAFSQLCGVRAHVENSPRISEPRGVPEDCCDYTREEIEHWGSDGHSHSFVTLAEIRDFRENLKPTPLNGMISPEQARELDEKGKTPESWCGWTSNDSWVYREWESKIDALKSIHEALEQRALERWWLKENIEPDNIRLVFFFDN